MKRGTVDRTAIRQAIREIKAGNPLGIFPEGTRIKRMVWDGFTRAWLLWH